MDEKYMNFKNFFLSNNEMNRSEILRMFLYMFLLQKIIFWLENINFKLKDLTDMYIMVWYSVF